MTQSTSAPQATQAAPSEPLVSVIITTYTMQRLPDLLKLMESLRAQRYPKLEVLFVGERDRTICTQVEAQAQQGGMANLRVLFNNGLPGLSPARNLGVRHAQGEIMAFIDDHAEAAPDWAEELVKAFQENPHAIGITGQAIPLWEDPSMNWLPRELYWMVSCTAGINGARAFPVRNAWGVSMAFRKEAFTFCQFSEDFGVSNRGTSQGIKLGLVGDDTEFGVRVTRATGRPILFDPEVKVLNKVYRYKLSPHFTRRAFWEGYTKAVLLRLYDRNGGFPLSSEYGALRRILFRFFPKVLGQFLMNPRRAWRRLSLAVDVLFHASLGYLSGRFSWVGRLVVLRYSR